VLIGLTFAIAHNPAAADRPAPPDPVAS
jgi:hypothetical protein